jgi:flagellar assembly factor FliW
VQTSLTRPAGLSQMEITFQRDMLGWVGAVHFVLENIPDDDAGMFAVLRCTDNVRLRTGVDVPSPRFLVTSPGFLWPEYQVALDGEFADSLDLVTPDDATLLVIVTQRTPLERTTVNLFSPIVVNRHTGLADQFVPAISEDEVGWRVRTPVPASLVENTDQGGQQAC